MSYRQAREGGATVETIMGVVERRVGPVEMAALRAKCGDAVVEDALMQTGFSHSGCEEIGSSDVYYMVQSFRKNLPEVPT